MSKKYKVLSLVGGGKFGAIPAKFLSYVSTQTDKGSVKDLDGVDFLSGTSIGGILSAGYSAGHSFKEVSDIFNARAKDCFVKRWQAKVNPLACPTYKGENLRSVIHDIIGDMKLGETRDVYPNLCTIIPALDITSDDYLVFQTLKANDYWEVPLVDVAQMTSAAQTYFPGFNFNNHCIVDAGVIDVPSLITSVTSIHGKQDVAFEDMDVLLMGIGDDSNAANEDPITPEKYNRYTVIEVFTKVIRPYLTFGNKLATLYWGNHLRFNSFTYWNPVKISGNLDDTTDIPKLIQDCEPFKDEFIKVWNKWISA